MTSLGHRLILLRHAKAESGGDIADALRGLAPRGERQCAEVGAGLRAAGLVPETVLVSSSLRTRQTWERVSSAMGDEPAPDVVVSDVLYGAGFAEVIDLVRATDTRVRTLLLVGHEPAMSATAAYLSGDGSPSHIAQVQVGLPTAGYAVLEVVESWSRLERLGAVLRDVVRPARPE